MVCRRNWMSKETRNLGRTMAYTLKVCQKYRGYPGLIHETHKRNIMRRLRPSKQKIVVATTAGSRVFFSTLVNPSEPESSAANMALTTASVVFVPPVEPVSEPSWPNVIALAFAVQPSMKSQTTYNMTDIVEETHQGEQPSYTGSLPFEGAIESQRKVLPVCSFTYIVGSRCIYECPESITISEEAFQIDRPLTRSIMTRWG